MFSFIYKGGSRIVLKHFRIANHFSAHTLLFFKASLQEKDCLIQLTLNNMSNTMSPPASPANTPTQDKEVKQEQRHSRTVVPVNITSDIERANNTLTKAFVDSPGNDYLMKKFFDIPIEQKVSKARVNSILHYFTALYADMGGEIVEANDFDAVAVFTKPGLHIDQGVTNDPKFNKTFFEDLTHKKHEVLPEGVDYYYLFILGKNLEHPEVRGSVRAIFETYKKKADEAGVAIVLEAISEHAKSVYEYFGFKNYLSFEYGRGEVDSKGNSDPNGEGFVGHLMIYYKDTLPGALA